MMNASMPTSITIINSRVAIIEVTMIIMSVNREIPSVRSPIYGAYKVIGC
jgi:hypothetical protein